MPLPNGNIGVKKNESPLVESVFLQKWEGEGKNPPPPGSKIRITDTGEKRITDTDNYRITD